MDYSAYIDAKQKGLTEKAAIQYAEYVAKKKRIKETGQSARKDSSKTKVYEAEWKFEEECSDIIGPTLTEKETVSYVRRIVKSKLWKDLTGGKNISVSFYKNLSNPTTAGMAFGSSIKLAPQCVTKYIILHELTHCAGFMHHDVAFRKCLLKMVSRFLGREPSNVLKKKFKASGLKMSRKTTILSPTEWVKAKEKMARLRSLKC
jgi:hypothetical protein